MHFLQGVFQMTAIAFIWIINNYHTNGLHLFWDTPYYYFFSTKMTLALNKLRRLICHYIKNPNQPIIIIIVIDFTFNIFSLYDNCCLRWYKRIGFSPPASDDCVFEWCLPRVFFGISFVNLLRLENKYTLYHGSFHWVSEIRILCDVECIWGDMFSWWTLCTQFWRSFLDNINRHRQN